MARVKDFTYTLAANQRMPISRVGQLIRCIDAAEAFSVQIDDGEEFTLQAGIGVRFVEPFNRLAIINGANSQQITVYVGDDEVDDSRQYGSVAATISSSGNLEDAADVAIADSTVTLIVAADADRTALHITNLSTSETIRVGTANITASRGQPVGPGLTFTLNSFDGAIYGYQESGASINVSVLEVKE